MPSKPVALWVISVGEMAGVGRHVMDVARVGIPGWEVRFLVPEGPLREELRGQHQHFVDLPFGPGPDAGLKTSMRSVSQAVRATGASIVHSHLAWADMVTTGTRIGSAIRISTEHGIAGDASTYARNRLDATAMNIAHTIRLRRTRGVICVSKATALEVKKRWHPSKRTKLVVNLNGIDRIENAGLAPAPPGRSAANGQAIGYLGRFAPEKRLDLLIRAFALLAKHHPKAVLRLAGAGETETQQRALVDRLNISNQVQFDGWVDSPTWLQKVDMLCLPSVWENCSYSILEALNLGLGVVAAPVGGNPELLPPTCLADPLDPVAFAEAIALQLAAPELRPRLPATVPTVAEMTRSIAGTYNKLV